MSKATKRKHVTKEVTDEFVLPGANQQIVKICGGRGNNLHEAVSPSGDKFLVSMPTKFRKNVWIKRGDYVIVDPIEEGDKVKAEITHILYKEQIKYIKHESLWPAEFSDVAVAVDDAMIPADMLPPSDDELSNEDLSDDEREEVHINNPNRPIQQPYHSDDSEDSQEGED